MDMIPLSHLGFLTGVFLANYMVGNNNLATRTNRQNAQHRKPPIHK